MKCVTMPAEKPKVLAPSLYAIYGEPIPSHNKNNKEVHLDYLTHLKESVGTLREIVEEAKVKQPLDNALEYACLYTKHSQELLEYAISSFLKEVSNRDKKIATAPLNRKKAIKDATAASGLKPRSNTKKDRTLPAKSDKKKVEDHPRNNKFSVKQKNRVDSSISYKCTVINSNSNSVCKTCNKCLMSFNHDKCVVKSLKFVKKPPINKVWRVKQVKQVWKATRKLFTNVGFRWQPTGKKFTLGEKCPLTRFTISKVVPVIQPESARTSEIMITKRLSNTSQKPLTRYQRKNKQEKAISTVTSIITVTQSIDDSVKLSVCSNVQYPNRNWGSNIQNSPYSSIFKCRTVRFENDHFGAIMGYGDYVIGDSVISRVYYVEGLGHNLFSVRQFCDLDLKVAFRKHSCYVKDVNGVELIKGNRGTNLYTISVEDMMKSSPICLLSKASKNKSWLWHRRLNHLNFGTINDLAREDLIRGLPRLKFEKDHLCLAC
ncbi:integrase, catalytic region, zinc finger, CCHC-type containing protein [Tanacetum coccineum]